MQRGGSGGCAASVTGLCTSAGGPLTSGMPDSFGGACCAAAATSTLSCVFVFVFGCLSACVRPRMRASVGAPVHAPERACTRLRPRPPRAATRTPLPMRAQVRPRRRRLPRRPLPARRLPRREGLRGVPGFGISGVPRPPVPAALRQHAGVQHLDSEVRIQLRAAGFLQRHRALRGDRDVETVRPYLQPGVR